MIRARAGRAAEGARETAAPLARRSILRVSLFVVLAALGGLLPSFSLPATLYVVAIGGVLVWLALSGRIARHAAPGRLGRGAAWWLVPTSFLVALELWTFSGGSTPDTPTLSILADSVLETYLGRAVAYFGWLSAFWAALSR